MFLKVLINLLATTNVSSLCVEYISIVFLSSHGFIDLLYNLLPFSTHILFGLWLDSSEIFWKALVIIMPYFIFQSNNACIFTENIKYAYNSILARSAPQILTIKGDCTFFLLIFFNNWFM